MSEDAGPTPESVAGQPWHALPPEEVVAELGTDPEWGLDEARAAARRAVFGENRPAERRQETLATVFLRQFRDPLIYILLIAGGVSLLLGNLADAVFIGGVLAFNAALGTYQEHRAEGAAEALQQVMRVTATVLRSGTRREADAADLVPGDVVTVQSGVAVPADVRLLTAQDLRADESLLTGESVPVVKRVGAQLERRTPLGDRSTLLHGGTTVLGGRGTGVVCRTGELTEVGHISAALAGEAQVPPLVVRMRRFTRVIAVAIVGVVAVLGLAEALRGESLADIFFLAVALAVSAIPAGLPVAITVALAIGSNRMAHRNVVVRRLPAVEGLGACTLIASDKTGTLTENRLTVRLLRPLGGPDAEVTGGGRELTGGLHRGGEPIGPEDESRIRRLAVTGALCNEGDVHTVEGVLHTGGDPVDIALLVLAHKLDLPRADLLARYPEIGRIPFEPERRFAVGFHRDGRRSIAHVKGAAETVARMCEVDARAVAEQEQRLAEAGYRVLALAAGEVDERTAQQAARTGDPRALTGLRFLGLAGLIDPLRKEVPDAVDACRNAGVDVRMVTGDHPATALAIGRRLGIAHRSEEVVTGQQLGAWEESAQTGETGETGKTGKTGKTGECRAGSRQSTQDERNKQQNGQQDDQPARRKQGTAGVRTARLYARVEPRQKTTIVNALQDGGHFVAVTGDGVNDAPALRTAHIGVAMGASGTDVARSAADLILTDDNFASIVKGIREGRIAYDNVRKVIWLLISTAVAELTLFVLSVAFGTQLPLTPVQLLWLNLVTNGIQDVALAFEKGEPGVLRRRPRRPGEGVFDRLMVEEVLVSGLYLGVVAFTLFYVLTEVTGTGLFEARNLLLLLLVLFENVHAFNVRSETRSVLRIPLRANRLLVGAVAVAQAVHIGSMFVPGWREVLGIEPVAFTTWAALLAITLSSVLVVEAYKRLRARRIAHGAGPATGGPAPGDGDHGDGTGPGRPERPERPESRGDRPGPVRP